MINLKSLLMVMIIVVFCMHWIYDNKMDICPCPWNMNIQFRPVFELNNLFICNFFSGQEFSRQERCTPFIFIFFFWTRKIERPSNGYEAVRSKTGQAVGFVPSPRAFFRTTDHMFSVRTSAHTGKMHFCSFLSFIETFQVDSPECQLNTCPQHKLPD